MSKPQSVENTSTRLEQAEILHSGSGDIFVGGSFVPTPTLPANHCNLPHRHPHFIGRRDELAKVIDALKSRAWIITIDGIGGIGKTTLALEAAHECRNNTTREGGNFDAFVWSSARHKTNFGLSDVLCDVLNVVSPGQPSAGSSDDDTLSAAVRALASEACLLIIDNFETVKDERLHRFLRDELPGPSKVLLTSRHHINAGERIVTLGGMPESDAVALLRSEAHRLNIPLLASDDVLLKVIASRAYGVPFVLRWVMEAVHGGRTLETILESLHFATADELFQYILRESLSRVDLVTRSVFAGLSLLSNGCTLDVIAALRPKVPALDERVGQLVSLSLVQDNRSLVADNGNNIDD